MCKFIKLQNIIVVNVFVMLINVFLLNYICLLQNQKTRMGQQGEQNIKFSPNFCELVMGLLSQGAILQMHIGPVPLRPDLVRPVPRPESTSTKLDAANTRPNAANENTRPGMAQLNPRPNPGRSETDLTRPERPVSRHPPARPVSPYTDWSFLSDNAEVISIPSEDDDYVPRSPEYEPDSPGPVQETEDWNPTSGEGAPDDHESGLSRTVFSTISRDANDQRPRYPLGRGTFMQMVPLFKGNRTQEKTPTRQNKAYVNFD